MAQRQELSEAAQAAVDAKDFVTARARLEQLVREDPFSAEALQRLGRVYLTQGDLARSDVAFRRALALDPEYADALVGLGEVESRTGRLEAALKHLEAAISLEPRRATAHVAEGLVLESLGRRPDALAAYFRALQASESHRCQ